MRYGSIRCCYAGISMFAAMWASAAQASDWRVVAHQALTGFALYVDQATEEVSPPLVTVWVKFDDKDGWTELYRWSIDCRASTIRALDAEVRDGEGLPRYSDHAAGDAHAIPPDSTAQIVQNAVCKSLPSS